MHFEDSKLNDFVVSELDKFQFSYDVAEWDKLNRKLSVKARKIQTTKYIVFSSLAIVLTFSSIYLWNSSQKVEKENSVEVRIDDSVLSTNNVPFEKENNSNINIIPDQSLDLITETTQAEDNSSPVIFTETTDILTYETVAQKDEQPDSKEILQNDYDLIPYFNTSENSGCSPLTVEFTPHEKGENIVYYWEFGDGNSSTEKSPAYTFKTPGEYFVRLTVKHYDRDKLYTMVSETPVVVLSLPEADFELTNTKNPYRFEAVGSPDCSWSWLINGESYSGGNVSIVFPEEKNYVVKLTAIGENGCKSVITKTIEVKNLIEFLPPTAFSPDGDGINDLYKPLFDETQIKKYYLQIYGSTGMMVFETHDLSKSWDGKIMGSDKIAEMGVYVCIIAVTDIFNVTKQFKYNITLLK